MKSFLLKFSSLVVLFFCSISFANASETTMRISLQLPLKSHLGQNLLLFKKEVENRSNGEITKGRIPPYSVVVPGTHKDLYAVHIIKTVDSKTRSKTSINDLLRD